MRISTKILLSGCIVAIAALASGNAYAKGAHYHNKTRKKEALTVGIKLGKSIQYNTPYIGKNNKKYLSTRSFTINKPINNSRFRVEWGLDYNTIEKINYSASNKIVANPYSVTMPVTIQYYFLPGKHKFNPYCGAGVQAEMSLMKNNSVFPKPDVSVPTPATNSKPGTKTVSVLFVQGASYEVNTKIQINESFHYTPGSNIKTIGVDIGVGYKIR